MAIWLALFAAEFLESQRFLKITAQSGFMLFIDTAKSAKLKS